MAKPNMLLLDEPSMGLAPQIVAEIFEIVRDLNQKEGVSILLAEQNTNVALKYADYGPSSETVMPHAHVSATVAADLGCSSASAGRRTRRAFGIGVLIVAVNC